MAVEWAACRVSFDFCECCLRQINLFTLLLFINRLEDDEAENTMSILVGECFFLLEGRLALYARSFAAESLKALYIILCRLRVWPGRHKADVICQPTLTGLHVKGLALGLIFRGFQRTLRGPTQGLRSRNAYIWQTEIPFQKKSQDRAKKSPGWIKPLTLILKKNQKDSGLILKIKGRFKFEFRLYGSVNSSCAEPAPQPPGLLRGICPPCKSWGWGILKFHGIKGKALEWIKSWLTNRTRTIVSSGRINLQGSSCDVWNTPRNHTWSSNVPLIIHRRIWNSHLGYLQMMIYYVYQRITCETDTMALQCDLDKLGWWAQSWQMVFNPSKCYKMSVYYSRSPVLKCYKPFNQVLSFVQQRPYLRILWSDDLQWNLHNHKIVKKANSTPHFVKRNLLCNTCQTSFRICLCCMGSLLARSNRQDWSSPETSSMIHQKHYHWNAAFAVLRTIEGEKENPSSLCILPSLQQHNHLTSFSLLPAIDACNKKPVDVYQTLHSWWLLPL